MKPSKPNTDRLHKESESRKALEKLEHNKKISEEKEAQECSEKKLKKAERARRTREKKRARKDKWEKAKNIRDSIGEITPNKIEKLKRPYVNNSGESHEDFSVHTYQSAEQELMSKGARHIVKLECCITSQNSILVNEEDHKRGIGSLSWLIPSIIVNGVLTPFFIPPTPTLYHCDDFQLNNDWEWEQLLREYNENLEKRRDNSPIEELCSLLGMHTTNEALDMCSPYVESSSLYKTSACMKLKELMMDLGLFDLDKHYIDLGIEFLYMPEGLMTGMSALTQANQNHKTHKSSPSDLLEGDPRSVWVDLSDHDVDSLREELRKYDREDKLRSCKTSDLLQRCDKALMALEFFVSSRRQLQELSLAAFKAGQEYSINYQIANNFEEVQKGLALSLKGNRKGSSNTEYTTVIKSIIEDYLKSKPGASLTEKPVRIFIEESNVPIWNEALLKASKTSLKNCISKYKKDHDLG